MWHLMMQRSAVKLPFFFIRKAVPVHHLWNKMSHPSPPRRLWAYLYVILALWFFFFFFLCKEKRKEFNQKGKLKGRQGWTEGRQHIIRRTEGWLDKQGQTCCLAECQSCGGGGDADGTGIKRKMSAWFLTLLNGAAYKQGQFTAISSARGRYHNDSWHM